MVAHRCRPNLYEFNSEKGILMKLFLLSNGKRQQIQYENILRSQTVNNEQLHCFSSHPICSRTQQRWSIISRICFLLIHETATEEKYEPNSVLLCILCVCSIPIIVVVAMSSSSSLLLFGGVCIATAAVLIISAHNPEFNMPLVPVRAYAQNVYERGDDGSNCRDEGRFFGFNNLERIDGFK